MAASKPAFAARLTEAIASRAAKLSLGGWSKLDELPFDFERRRISVLVEKDDARMLIVKGAAEEILARAKAVDHPDGRVLPIDEATRATLQEMERDEADQGNRVLAVAWKPMPPACSQVSAADECDLVNLRSRSGTRNLRSERSSLVLCPRAVIVCPASKSDA
jgi:Mg2+-importing ATPase